MKGIVCGVMLCRNFPILQCPRCSLHYCSEYVKTHFHPSPEDEYYSSIQYNIVMKDHNHLRTNTLLPIN